MQAEDANSANRRWEAPCLSDQREDMAAPCHRVRDTSTDASQPPNQPIWLPLPLPRAQARLVILDAVGTGREHHRNTTAAPAHTTATQHKSGQGSRSGIQHVPQPCQQDLTSFPPAALEQPPPDPRTVLPPSELPHLSGLAAETHHVQAISRGMSPPLAFPSLSFSAELLPPGTLPAAPPAPCAQDLRSHPRDCMQSTAEGDVAGLGWGSWGGDGGGHEWERAGGGDTGMMEDEAATERRDNQHLEGGRVGEGKGAGRELQRPQRPVAVPRLWVSICVWPRACCFC